MEDRLDAQKSIYEANYGEVFFKNFLAGFGRAIGSIFIYMIFLVFASYMFMTYAYPQVKPFVDQYMATMETLKNVNKANIIIKE